ncbi:hypothetical protein [uncultured Roseobacter sp.]|uniref:DUF7678 domain-containing protein n=1 Tax=uncultured Roseobacter sp. TaxID=114847 RepID=UPI002632A363|nr:hypothetical protein [uncultured Roseobacter sp.]
MADDKSTQPAKIPFQRSEKDKIDFKRAEEPSQEMTNPDGSPLRNKDNAQPELKPGYAYHSQQNLAPGGATGIRTTRASKAPEASVENDSDPAFTIEFVPDFEVPAPDNNPSQEQAGLSIDGSGRDDDLWISGRIVDMPGYSFDAKQYDEPSRFGIEGGTISKLEIRKDDELVIHYQRGWDIEPQTAEQKEALHRIRTGLDDGPTRRIAAPDRDPGNGHDIER